MKRILLLIFFFPILALADFPWYDTERQDYRKYTAEELREVMPEETQSAPAPVLEAPPVSLFLLEILLYLLAAVALFFAVRWLIRRKPQAKEGRSSVVLPVKFQEYTAFQEVVQARTAAEIRERIERAIAAMQLREAGKLIFIYLVARMTEKGELAVSGSLTAREIAREMKKIRPDPLSIIERSRQAFEKSLYAGREEPDLPHLWQTIATEWPG
ncbi:MAG: hypothetical protein HS115_02610 [Spirochaetales bacterium]|nr:hypothetical protein [Spirochaetales bacterium]